MFKVAFFDFNICKALVFFDKMYDKMNDAERREFIEQLIEKVEVYEDRQFNDQWLRAIEFKPPIIEHDMKLSLDNGDSVETVCLLERLANRKPDTHVKRSIDVEKTTKSETTGECVIWNTPCSVLIE